MRFSSGSQHHGQDLHSEANFRGILEHAKDFLACFADLEKVYERVSWDKLWKVLQAHDVDGQLLRTIKSFYCRKM